MSSKGYSDIYKTGRYWKACYDKTRNRYIGHICHSDRESQEWWSYTIPKQVFDALDESKENSENESLIESGRVLAHYESSLHYGPAEGALRTYDADGENAWSQAYESALEVLEARFFAGDESTLNLWKDFLNHSGEKNKERGTQILMKAAESGVLEAQKELAEAYCYGRDTECHIEQDSEKAEYWFELATEKRSAYDQYFLGSLFRDGSWNLKKNPVKAAYWYAKAAERGLEEAQLQIGLCYAEGTGVEKSYEKAALWLSKAAEQGNSKAQFNLGVFYSEGWGVEKSTEKAFYWYTKSAEKGFDRAQYNLGCFYEDGRAGKKDLEQAVLWWRKSAEQGYDKAEEKLSSLKKDDAQ